jgi:PAS domain S-box-containing protein
MIWLHALSLLCRVSALGWSLILLRRVRDARLAALSLLIALLSFRGATALLGATRGEPQPWQSSELVIGLCALLSVYSLERVLRESQKTSEALRTSEAHFRSLVENAIDVVAVLDHAGRFIYVSPSVQRVLGWSPDELLGRISLDFVHEDDRPQVAHEFFAAMDTLGSSRGGVCRMKHKDGGVRMMQSRGGGVAMPGGKKHGMLNLRDVTAEHSAEAEKQRLQTQLYQAQKMETLGSMAGGIAHDFNNLLTPILGNAELARAALPPHSSAHEHVLRMSEAAQRGKALVQRVLLLSQKAQGNLESIDLPRAVVDVLALLEPSLAKNIALSTELDPSSGRVRADVTHVHQLLFNLCANAAHAMRVRGGRLTIRVVPLPASSELRKRHPSFAGRGCVLIEVSDTGTGMDASTLEHAFEPFFSTKEVGESSGLGLSIVYGIVRSLGGVIDVQSEIDRGSRFSLLLPTYDEAPPPRRAARSAARRPSQGRVLLIDDDRAVLSVCRELLELLGYEVTPASDPETALELFAGTPGAFDAVVTDQTMPKLTGVELAQALVRLRPNIPIVMTTGFAEAEVVDRGQNSPIAEVVSKPYTLEDLGAAITRALERKRSPAPSPTEAR